MAAPRYSISQMPYRNPHAQAPLLLTVLVVANTSDEDLARNIKSNAALDLPWLAMHPAHDKVAVMVGGGPSAHDFLADIADWSVTGTVFAMNGASTWLRHHGVIPDYQVIADAKPETASLVDVWARGHLFASQVDPSTMAAAQKPTVWHLAIGDVENLFPSERLSRGGYAMIGGGAAVGNSALCVAYALGYRKFEIFGFDSSHREDRSHAYEQPMNRFIPCVDVEWAGKTYHSSIAMKAQAERFQITARELERAGCALTVHGDGLLPAMWNTPPEAMSERDKYRLMWTFDTYREVAPGEEAVDTFLEAIKPTGRIIDFGCGTGRASIAIARAGHDVLLVDFADNCRDDEALRLPFVEADLAHPLTVSAPHGLCCDVMEHIPPHDVEAVIGNIMNAAPKVFFQIATEPDNCGAIIGHNLHLTVRPAEWWLATFERLGFAVDWLKAFPSNAQFVVSRKAAQ